MSRTHSIFRWRNHLIFLLSLVNLTTGFAAEIENIPSGKNIQIRHNSIYAVSFCKFHFHVLHPMWMKPLLKTKIPVN